MVKIDHRHIVRAAAGVCPIRFSMFWDLQGVPPDPIIASWFWEIRRWGLEHDRFYTAEAIANWASSEFDMTTPEFDHVYSVIMEYAEQIGEKDIDDALAG